MNMNLNHIKLTPRRLQCLQNMGIDSIEDLLRRYPHRYEHIEIVAYEQWQPGDSISVEGLICKPASVIRLKQNRSMTKFTILAWNEEFQVTMFNRPWTQQFIVGKTITLFGQYQGQHKILVQNYNFKHLEQQVGMQPIYSLPSDGLKQNEFRQIIKQALMLQEAISSLVPKRYQEKYRLLPMKEAIQAVHFPQSETMLHQAVRTLKYEEFLCFQCAMQAMRQQNQTIVQKLPKHFDEEKIRSWQESLPFSLTKDQQACIDQLLKELQSPKMMFRLVQGDVGCGKTMVAVAALWACTLAECQSAFLAPTEILARQHFETLQKQGLPVYLLVSSLPTKEKQKILALLESGETMVVVGTHALFQEQVKMKNLGFVVVDEQQRFGVKQRRALLEKGKNVDFLMMSATPIPRTYAHFLYGDMDISNIHTMPEGRKSIVTRYISSRSMKPILQEVLNAIEEGAQCYVVCPSIENHADTTMRSAQEIYEGMKKTLSKEVRIGLLHGKMKADEKEKVMKSFSDHQIDILVSTTVIEVGIDVKNANVMVVYDAHRFGLSTLHQLRGRVGRGTRQGICYLMSSTKEEEAIRRLKKMEELTDGFAISAYDLKMRGPGDLLGVRQSGLPGFMFADLDKDQAMMEACIQDAKEVLFLQEDKELIEYTKKAIEHSDYFD